MKEDWLKSQTYMKLCQVFCQSSFHVPSKFDDSKVISDAKVLMT